MPQNPIKSHSLDNEVLVVQLTGSLDVNVQKPFKEGIEKLLVKESDVVLDMAQVTFVDSSCLGAMVSLLRRARESRGNVKLATVNEDVRAILEITRLDRVFEIHESVKDAVESYFK